MYIWTNDFLTEEERNHVYRSLVQLPYYLDHSVHAAKDGVVGLIGDYSDCGILAHTPLNQELVSFIMDRFAAKYNVKVHEYLRTRAHITFRVNDKRGMDPHVDLRRRQHNYTFVYYANDSDGNINLFKKRWNGEYVDGNSLELYKSFTPKAGYALFFDGDIYHNWENPDKTNFRYSIVINIACDVDESLLEKVDF